MTISNAEASERVKRAATPVSSSVERLVKDLGELDSAGRARAAIADQLARKMDTPGTGATSLALLSRELRSVLADLVDPSRDAKAASLIAEIFGGKS